MNAERKETVDAVADELLHICDISAPEGYMSLIEVRDFANRFKTAAKRERKSADLRTIHALDLPEREHLRDATKKVGDSLPEPWMPDPERGAEG